MSNMSKLQFMNGWKIVLSKLPDYDHFKGDFVEKLDWKILKLIYESPFLESKSEIKANLKNLIEKTVHKSGELKVKHNQRYKCGRFYADDSISMIPMSRYVKHTVFKYLGWMDIDMVKGHPSIAIEMGKLVGLNFSSFENYVNNFDKIVTELSAFYSVEGETPLDKDNIKWLFNSMIYGGGFANWVKGVQKGDESYESKKMKNETTIHPIIASFKNECIDIMDKIYRDNPALVKKVAEKKSEIYEKKCSVCSYWFQIIENHIVYIVAEHLINCGILTPQRYGLEYDGLNIPPCAKFDQSNLISEVNDLVVLTTGLNIKFKFKEYDDCNILFDILEARERLDGVEDEDDDDDHDKDDDDDDDKDMETDNEDGGDSIILDSLKRGVNGDDKVVGFTDYDLAKIVHHYYNDLFVCVDIKENKWYEFKNHRWAKCDNATTLRKLISEELRQKYASIATRFNELNKTKKSKKVAKKLQIISIITEKLGKTNDKNNIMRECKDLFYKNDFEEKLNENVHLLCFTNGIFDYETLLFRDGKPDDMVSICTNVELKPLDDEGEGYLDDVKRRLFYEPLGKEVGDYFLLSIAQALSGKRLKRIEFGLGGTNRGKSTVTTACLSSLGDYAGSFNAENLAYRNTSQDEAQIMRWALLLRHKRIIFSNEMKSTVELNGNMIKKISSGGDRIIGRSHCKEETSFVCDFLAVCMSNDLNNIKPYDEAVSKRVRIIPYEKEFVDEPSCDMELKKDPNLEQEMKTDLFKQAFVTMLVMRYVQFVEEENGIETEPEEVANAKRDWTGDEGGKYKYVDKFLEDFEITNNPNDFTFSKNMEEWLESKNFGISYILFTKELKKYCNEHNFDSVDSKLKKFNGKPHRSWFGVKERKYNPEWEVDT